jgi:acetoin utilization deacetylase AcuC-like enzyme
MRLYYTDDYEIPLPAGHKFPIRKYRLLRELLSRDRCFKFVPAPLAQMEAISLAHDPAYVAAFLSGNLSQSLLRRIGFPWSEALVKRTLASVGGTLAASAEALRIGFGGTLAGGTHHAFRSEGAGFCVFNDIAVAIRALMSTGAIRRAAVVDLDVHQGDGTAKIFEDDPTVFTVSVHSRNNFPFRKQSSDIDIDLPDGAGDTQLLGAVWEVLPSVVDFCPDIVFYQSGVDGLSSDTLGRLAYTSDGLRRRDSLVFETCRTYEIPCVITLGGGYSNPIELTVEAHGNTFRAAAGVFHRSTSAELLL